LVTGAGYSRQSRDSGSSEGGVQYLLGADYQIGEQTTLRASTARKLRYPTLRDLYAADRGNPDLKAETTYTYDLALHHQFGTAGPGVELTVFRIDADDFIERAPDGSTRNFEQYRFSGVELSARYVALERLELAAGYTYMKSKNLSTGADIDTLQNRPEHKISLRADYALTPALRIGGNYIYAANSYALSRNTPTTALEIGDYGVLDLDASFDMLQGRLRAYARVRNALDENYEESFGFPQPGRAWVLGAEYRL